MCVGVNLLMRRCQRCSQSVTCGNLRFEQMRTRMAAVQQQKQAVVVVGLAHMDGLESRWAEQYGSGAVSPIDTTGMLGG